MDNFIIVELAGLIGAVIWYGQKLLKQTPNNQNYQPVPPVFPTPIKEIIQIVKCVGDDFLVIREEDISHPDISHVFETEGLAIRRKDGRIQYTKEDK